MQPPENSFDFNSYARIEPAWLERVLYRVRAVWRHFRILRGVTRLFGPQYRRSRDRIEIDITYACNLHCLNCNRSVTQAPENLHLDHGAVRAFVDTSIARGKRWRRMRILGGEPTLHPQFHEIVAELLRYRDSFPECVVEVVSNGYGVFVEAQLARLPREVWIDNSLKTSRIQPQFGPFNDAPIDDPAYARVDYRNGCAIASDCGMGLTPTGYYPCAIAGGIERNTTLNCANSWSFPAGLCSSTNRPTRLRVLMRLIMCREAMQRRPTRGYIASRILRSPCGTTCVRAVVAASVRHSRRRRSGGSSRRCGRRAWR